MSGCRPRLQRGMYVVPPRGVGGVADGKSVVAGHASDPVARLEAGAVRFPGDLCAFRAVPSTGVT